MSFDESHNRWQFGDVVIDARRRWVTVAGRDVSLRPRAFALLVALAREAGATLSRQELLRMAWGHDRVVTTRTVDVHIAELRRKLERDPAEPKLILTVHRVGYRLRPSSATGE